MFTKHLTCNKVPAKLQDINYEYYIEQANKLLLRGNISTERAKMKTIEIDGKVYVEKPAEDFFTQDFGADDVGKSTCIGCDLWHKQITVGCNQGYPYCEDASIIWVEKK